MRKLYFLFAAFLTAHLLQAQTTPTVSFSFTVVPNTTTVNFSNTSKNLGEGLKKAYWSFGDGVTVGTGALDGTAHHYATGGRYEVCLKIYRYPTNTHDSILLGSACKVIEFPTTATMGDCSADFTLQPITSNAYGRKLVAQIGHSRGKKPLRVCWKFGDGKERCTDYANTYTGDYWMEHVYDKPGVYEACVDIRYEDGCESHKCKNINIAQADQTKCEAVVADVTGNAATPERKFYAYLQANRTAEKICWKFGDGRDTCIDMRNPMDPEQLRVTHRYPAPGSYNVCIRVVYTGGCVAENCKKVEITMPKNNICGGYFTDSVVTENTIRFAATGIHNPDDFVTGYLWTFGDGTSATQQQLNHKFSAPGTYAVCVVIKTHAGCETKICKPLEVKGHSEAQLTLMPNPVINTLTAIFQSNFQQTVSVRIYNSSGRLVKSYSRNVLAGANTWSFDLSGLSTGVYSMVVQSSNQFATAIFFKQ
ncbi:MAG TPA: PKD domain-containing protein [Flavisolibacter sp.]|nr:PKD domain-containing protein [Flavisolibacter sp.]